MGYLSLPGVIATAAIAGSSATRCCTGSGAAGARRSSRAIPKLAALRPRATQLLDKYGGWAAFGFRFMVGMRLAGAIAIGAAGFPQHRYLPANAAGAIVWAVLIGSAGYAFGQAFTLFLERARHLELAAFAVLAVIGVVTGLHAQAPQRQWAGASAPR
jgi:membrane protein DedA with SNARE-associated domain